MSDADIRDRVVNNILLLYLIREANLKGHVEDTLKLQKLVFLAQKKFLAKSLKVFSYNFFRWDKGPFSADINNDLTSLTARGLVKNRWPIQLTKEGLELLDNCEEVTEENYAFLSVIDEVISDFAKYTPEEIKEHVYEMKIFVPRLRDVMTIAEIPRGTLILFKPSDKRSKSKFVIDNGWCATLEVALDQEAIESLRQSYDDAIEGNVHEFQAL